LEDSDNFRYQVIKLSETGNEYQLTVSVPQETTKPFQSAIILSHPTTSEKTRIPIYFEGVTTRPSKAPAQRPRETYSEEEREIRRTETKAQQGTSYTHYFLMVSLLVAIICFILVNFAQIDPIEFVKDIINCRSPFKKRQAQQPKRQFSN